MAPDSPPAKQKPGRPKGSKTRSDSYKAIKRDFVEGQPFMDPDTGKWTRKYPTNRELADRYGVSPSLPSKWAKRDKWLVEREKFRLKLLGYTNAGMPPVNGKGGGTGQEGAPAGGGPDALDLVNRLLEGASDLADGERSLKVETIQDLERLAKFQVWLQAEKAKAGDPSSGVITLAQLQARHMHRRRAELAAVLTGEIDPNEDAAAAEGAQHAAANQTDVG